MSILTGVVIVVGCSAAGFLVAILIVNLRAKLKKPVPVRASRRQVDLPDFQSIPQEATARLDAIYEKAFDALKEMDPKKPTKLIEKSGPAKQTQKTVNRQVLASMVGPSYYEPNEIKTKTIEARPKILSETFEETQKRMDKTKRSRRVVCQKCGHKWLPLNKKLPKHCPNCHTTIWNKK